MKAVLRRHRDGLIAAPDVSLLLASLERDLPRFSVGPLADALALEARDLLRKHVSVPLRTLDAPQLAMALRFVRNRPMNWTLATSDHRMLAAAASEGVTTYDPAAAPAPWRRRPTSARLLAETVSPRYPGAPGSLDRAEVGVGALTRSLARRRLSTA